MARPHITSLSPHPHCRRVSGPLEPPLWRALADPCQRLPRFSPFFFCHIIFLLLHYFLRLLHPTDEASQTGQHPFAPRQPCPANCSSATLSTHVGLTHPCSPAPLSPCICLKFMFYHNMWVPANYCWALAGFPQSHRGLWFETTGTCTSRVITLNTRIF